MSARRVASGVARSARAPTATRVPFPGAGQQPQLARSGRERISIDPSDGFANAPGHGRHALRMEEEMDSNSGKELSLAPRVEILTEAFDAELNSLVENWFALLQRQKHFEDEEIELSRKEETLTIDATKLHYEVGHLALKCSDATVNSEGKLRFKYGRRVVATMAEKLKVDETFVRRCIAFARKFTPKEIEALGVCKLPWRAIESVITVDDDTRCVQFIEEYQQGEFGNSDEFRERVSDYNARHKVVEQRRADRKPTRQETAAARRRRKALDEAVITIRKMNIKLTGLGKELLHELISALNRFPEIREDVEPEAAQAIVEDAFGIVQAIGAIRSQLKDVEDAAKKVAIVEIDRDA